MLEQSIGYYRIFKDNKGIHYIQTNDGAMCVPLTSEGDVLFIVEFAPAVGNPILYLPAGGIELEETPEMAANREMQEELGYKAAQLNSLGMLHPWAKYLDARVHLFLARDLTPSRLQGDEDEEIGIFRHPLADFETLIAEKKLIDSTVIAVLFMTRAFLATKS